MPNLFNRKTDSAPSHPTLATTTTPNAKRISLRSPVGLPPSLQVPPSPLSIHKALLVRATARGLRVRPKAGSNQLGSSKKGGVVLGWGVKGKLSAYEQDEGEEDEGEEVEVKGLVGIVRLWNNAYLLVIIAPKLIGTYPTPSHELFSLTNVQAIPLTLPLAQKALARIQAVLAKLPSDSLEDAASATATPSAADLSAAEEDSRRERSQTGSTVHERSTSTRSGEVNTPGMELLSDSEEEEEEEGEDDISDAESKSSIKAGGGRGSTKRNPFFPWNPFASLTGGGSSTTTSPLVPTLPPVIAEKSAEASGTASLSSSTTTLKQPLFPASLPATTGSAPATGSERSHLETKVLASVISLFISGQMFFSYETDLTNATGRAGAGGAHPHLPLWRRVDRRFWWNEWMSRDFVDAGLHAYILPVMQGWVQITNLQLPREVSTPAPAAPSDSTVESTAKPVALEPPELVPVELLVVSRRSRDRAGLRFQRRGIDDEGNVANFVETEMIIRTEGHIFSYLQIRGSIPLFWSQSPYSTPSSLALKPAPVLDRALEVASGPMATHFARLAELYGGDGGRGGGEVTAVGLSETTGKEGIVTVGYKEMVGKLERGDVEYIEFDFHNECRGMKFENVSRLIAQLEDKFEAQGYNEATDKEGEKKSQRGIFRTNCIDCLDRTNVVQSAIARHVLGVQLASVGISTGSTTVGSRMDLEMVFNDVWANNGDAISRAYAGTSALKGDFTRTGKRDLQGMINDGLNSLARMYSSSFSDFFAQAVISFALGQRSIAVFTEFVEKLQVEEPANLLRLSVIRTEAIETCSARVIAEGEARLAGWTLYSPREMSVKSGGEFEEKVLLLTAKALYVCSYDFNLEKVVGFTRIPLGNVVQLQKGAYILSPLQEAGQDSRENHGFTITFRGDDETRLTSYSMRNQPTTSSQPPSISKSTGSRPRSALFRPLTLGSKKSAAASSSSSGTAMPPTAISVLDNDVAEDAADVRYFAFKAIARDVFLHGRERSVDNEPVGGPNDFSTCDELVALIVERIKVACSEAGSGWDSPDRKFVVDEPIISLEEAERNTTWATRIEYGIKRFLWL